MGFFKNLFGGSKKDSNVGPPKNTGFAVSDALMEEERFWQIIQATKEHAAGDFDQQQAELARELRKLTATEIILFANRFIFFRAKANTWELWGAIYIIHGGCGDDSFNDFREWVIGQGKDFYYRTIKDPETLIEVDADKLESIEWEGLGYIPSAVFHELTGQELPYSFQGNNNTTGTAWQEDGDDLKNMFPTLYKKYIDNV
jgi:hypothetical protein